MKSITIQQWTVGAPGPSIRNKTEARAACVVFIILDIFIILVWTGSLIYQSRTVTMTTTLSAMVSSQCLDTPVPVHYPLLMMPRAETCALESRGEEHR